MRVSSTDQNEGHQILALGEVLVPEKPVLDDLGRIVKAWEQKKLPSAEVLKHVMRVNPHFTVDCGNMAFFWIEKGIIANGGCVLNSV